MKQLLQNLKTGVTQVVDVPVPVIRPGFVLIRTRASLVSAGTERMLVEFGEKNLVEKARSRPDLVKQVITKARKEGILATVEAAFNRLDQPMPLGYSSAGVVVEVGNGVSGYQPGDRVACAGGGYAIHAEYAVVPQNLLAKLPASIEFDEACFATMGAIALHGFRLAAPQVGERVAIIGLGLLGLLAAGIARAAGCEVFGIDLSPERVKLAQQLGFQASSREGSEKTSLEFTNNAGFDHVLICADTKSNDPVELAAAIARDRAKVVSIGAVGLSIPRKPYYEKELEFIVSRSYGPGRYDTRYEEQGVDYPAGYVRWTEGRNLQAIVDLMSAGKFDVKPLITHRFEIDKAPAAYELITGKSGEYFLAVVLVYPQSETEKIERTVQINSQVTTQDIQIGIIGAGNYANATFLPAINKVGGVGRVGIASAAGAHALIAASKFGFQYATSETEKLLADPSINTVVLLTRHNLHTPQTLAAFAQNKHVYCEKPPAIDLAQLEQLTKALSTTAHPAYMVGYNRRYAPLAVKLKATFSASSQPMLMNYRVNAGALPLNHWTHDPLLGGGRIIGEGCHFIDFMTWLCGSLPVEGYINALPDTDRYLQDNVVVTLRFANGSVGSLHYLANGDSAMPKEYIEVSQAGSSAVLHDFQKLETWQNGKHTTISGGLRQDKGHSQAWAAFLESIRTGQAAIPAQEILQPAELTIRLIENLRKGICEPIRV
jgi:predicted dehydrogenase/threonine dehydrogenase-like Zn-dependent dehydrogenase